MAQDRRDGFCDALADDRADRNHCYIAEGDFSIEAGMAATERLLTRYPRPTAIFAANDEMAVGVLQALKRAGVVIGREISVVGYDDQRLSRLYEPAITTVQVPKFDLGYEAMTLLQAVIAGEDVAGRNIILPTVLVERATTAAWHG